MWVWTTTTMGPTASSPSSPATPSAPDAEHGSPVEKFFGGDPDRNVRKGQEMKPRW
ncbi:DUF2749 domain-containing protein [Mesorhizobium sp. INR15]|uniref:DUF2749 domain-containing protein n=1 Tax=Mesorhizobium sp. INR15 TaxID=2654248 RepID=UPI0035BC8C8B